MKRLIVTAIVAVVCWLGMPALSAAPLADNGENGQAQPVEVVDDDETAADLGVREAEVEMRRLQMFEHRDENKRRRHYENIKLLATIVGLGIPFGSIVLIFYLLMTYRRQRNEARYQLMEKAITAGRDLPDSFFDHPAPVRKTGRQSLLIQGVVCLSIGLGAFAMWLGSDHGKDIAVVLQGLSVVFVLMGVGRILIASLDSEGKSKKED